MRTARNFKLSAAILVVLSSIFVGGVAQGAGRQLPLAVPDGLTVTATSDRSIAVTFQGVAGSSSYTVRLYGSKLKGKNASTDYPFFVPGASIMGLKPVTTYQVTVQAIDSSKSSLSSKESAPVSVTTTADLCLSEGNCAIGDTGPGGGTIYYVSSSAFTETGAPCASSCHYLELAPSGWDAPTSTVDPKLVWSTDLGTLIGATGQAIGTGYSNTAIMYASGNSPAANAVHAYSGGGKTDWFIASSLESAGLYTAASVYTNAGFVYPELIWTSTEQTASKAYYVYFDGSVSTDGTKTDATPQVRPIRAF